MLKNVVALIVCLLGALPAVAADRSATPAAKQAASETTLAAVRRSDAADRDARGNLKKLAPAEHMRRAAVYLSVRAFAEARAHWQTLIDNYPQDMMLPFTGATGLGAANMTLIAFQERSLTYIHQQAVAPSLAQAFKIADAAKIQLWTTAPSSTTSGDVALLLQRGKAGAGLGALGRQPGHVGVRTLPALHDLQHDVFEVGLAFEADYHRGLTTQICRRTLE